MVDQIDQFTPAVKERLRNILFKQAQQSGFDLVAPRRVRRYNEDVRHGSELAYENARRKQLDALRASYKKHERADELERHNILSHQNSALQMDLINDQMYPMDGAGFLVREEDFDDHPVEKRRRGGLAPHGSSRKLKGGKKGVAKNPWIAFYKQYRKAHPGMVPKKCMKMAGEAYRKQKGGVMVGGKAKAKIKFRKSGTPKRAKVTGTSREVRKLLEDLF